jgi:hypothetical protein
LKSIVWQFIVFGGVLDICRKREVKSPGERETRDICRKREVKSPGNRTRRDIYRKSMPKRPLFDENWDIVSKFFHICPDR